MEVEELIGFLSSPSPQVVSKPAAQALVNQSQKPELAVKMVEMRIVETSMETLYKQDCEIKSLLIMLLVNLTQLDAGIDSCFSQQMRRCMAYMS